MACCSPPQPEPGDLSHLVPLADVPRLLPAVGGKKPNISTVWRWCLRGIGGTKLEAVRIGRCWYTTPEAIQAFGRALAAQSIERLDRPKVSAPTEPRTRSEAKRARDVEAAKSRLRDIGALS
ncbi:MAG: DUF1580 domain-containing protein [Candidatus Hydrogenedentes bacterium]|nr:DUF1580 domain-containing protein [Candidatus Hydrogenedentota bacterium]